MLRLLDHSQFPTRRQRSRSCWLCLSLLCVLVVTSPSSNLVKHEQYHYLVITELPTPLHSSLRETLRANRMPLFQSPARPPYRKVLYLRQHDYPDNYVDSSFLADLQRNVNVHPASLPVLLCQTLPITQHLACTFIFLSIFVRLSRGSLDPPRLLTFCAFLGIGCRVWSHLVSSPSSPLTPAPTPPQPPAPPTLNGDISPPLPASAPPATTTPPTQSSSSVAPLIPLVTLYLLSPALKTLTKATTSDSIWALSGTLFAVNLFLGDYRSIPSSPPLRPSPPRLPSTLSLTAALSGSTVLASRLSSNVAVFSLLLFSTLWFGPFPLLRSDLSLRPTIVLTLLLVLGALWSLVGIGGGAVKIASLLLVGIAVGAPMGRGWLMIRYKDRVRGPWDQAVPRVGGSGG